jgi:hypothetical protein
MRKYFWIEFGRMQIFKELAPIAIHPSIQHSIQLLKKKFVEQYCTRPDLYLFLRDFLIHEKRHVGASINSIRKIEETDNVKYETYSLVLGSVEYIFI